MTDVIFRTLNLSVGVFTSNDHTTPITFLLPRGILTSEPSLMDDLLTSPTE